MKNAHNTITCTVRVCPRGCTVLTIGPAMLHLSPGDFTDLVRAMLKHADALGLPVAEARPAPDGVALH